MERVYGLPPLGQPVATCNEVREPNNPYKPSKERFSHRKLATPALVVLVQRGHQSQAGLCDEWAGLLQVDSLAEILDAKGG